MDKARIRTASEQLADTLRDGIRRGMIDGVRRKGRDSKSRLPSGWCVGVLPIAVSDGMTRESHAVLGVAF